MKIYLFHLKIRKLFPFSVECKNQEKLNIWSSLEQSKTIVVIIFLWLYLKEIEQKHIGFRI